MSEEEMRERIKEIKKEEDVLMAERAKYEQYFADKKRENELSELKSFIGKYFITRNLDTNKNKHIKAFKIFNIGDMRYAECVVLIDSFNNGIREFGIKTMNLPLWHQSLFRTNRREPEPKMIDMYTEILEEEFVKMRDEVVQELIRR